MKWQRVWIAVLAVACSSDERPGLICQCIDGPIGDVVIEDNCSPLTQTGCSPGTKCTWIWDQLPPPGQTTPPALGHKGCTAPGQLALGASCGPRTLGGDACATGLLCSEGFCRKICDPNHATSVAACDAEDGCALDPGTFLIGGTPIAGVCRPGCDPNTQRELRSGAEACGSPNRAAPTMGCYGTQELTCRLVAPTLTNMQALLRRDRATPAGDYLAACAPGYTVVLKESTGSMDAICSGFCAALQIDSTPAHTGNVLGDASVLGKFPSDAAPFMGNATCKPDAQHGRGGAVGERSECRFLWPYNEDAFGEVLQTPFVDTLGICVDLDHYQYDSDGDGTPDLVYPSCSTLPPRSAATPGLYDDAADWGCQKRETAAMGLHDVRGAHHVPAASLSARRFE